MSARTHFDVAVIGGGHNGLVCACYLAAAGLSVCVLERHERVGGAAVTEEFHPGFRNSVASYTVSLLQTKVVRDLRLHDHGLKILPRPLDNFVPSLNGCGLKLPGELDRKQTEIARHSQADADRYPRFAQDLTAISQCLRPMLMQAPVDSSAGWRAWWNALRQLSKCRHLSFRQIRICRELLTGSAGYWLERNFETDLLLGGLGFNAIVGHFASPYDQGSAYLLLHHSLGELNGQTGAWGHAVGGMGAITDALAAAAATRGVDIRVRHQVERIAQCGRRFELHSDSAVVTADRVAAAIHPQTLYTQLIASDELPPRFLQRMRNWRSESASFRLNVALSELPDFRCLPGRVPAEHHGAGILIAPSLDYLDQAHQDARRAGYSSAPVIELMIPSTIDDTLAPRGAHVASLFCQHFRRNFTDGSDWSAHKQAAVDRIIAAVTDYAPNFRTSILALQAFTPQELEQRFALVGGDIFHGVMSPDQLYWSRPAFGYARYRSPIEGLYMCASGTHPGGGVSGAPGHNAARIMISDLQAEPTRRHRR